MPFFKYAEVIASLADPVHGYSLREWMAYDVRFRQHMLIHYHDHVLWTRIVEQVWRDNSASQNTVTFEQTRLPSSADCHFCGMQNHQWRACPSRFQDNSVRNTAMPFRGCPAQESETQVCHKFNDGNCPSPCRWGQILQCIVCNASSHGRFNHPRGHGQRL